MDEIIQEVSQTSIVSPYISGICKGGMKIKTEKCEKGDWAYGKIKCGNGILPFQYKCSKLDPETCPRIGGNDGNAEFEEAPIVKCKYNISDFEMSEDIENWLSVWGENLNYVTRIMPEFCTKKTNMCPKNPVTSEQINECSRLISIDSEGEFCKSWKDKYQNIASETKNRYCSTFNTNECLCINREDDPLYKDIQNNLNNDVPDKRWWKPCQDENEINYLIPENMSNDEEFANDNICIGVNYIINKNNLKQKYQSNEIKERIACNINSEACDTHNIQDPLYKDIKKFVTEEIPDRCWWSSCSNQNNNLNEIIKGYNNTCPLNLCEKIQDIIERNNLRKKYSDEEIQSKIICNFNFNNVQENKFSLSTTIIIIIILLIMIIGTIIIIYIYYNKR
mgnify:CR=1 FL=1